MLIVYIPSNNSNLEAVYLNQVEKGNEGVGRFLAVADPILLEGKVSLVR